MRRGLEHVELLRIGVPEGANAFETAGAVLQRMRQQSERGLAVRPKRPAVVDDELRKIHVNLLGRIIAPRGGRTGGPLRAAVAQRPRFTTARRSGAPRSSVRRNTRPAASAGTRCR